MVMVVYVVVCHIPVRLLRHFADAPQRRGGQISHFLLALAKTPYEIGGPKPTEFVTFTKVGTGYNMAELNELWGKLRDHWKPVCVADCACCVEAPSRRLDRAGTRTATTCRGSSVGGRLRSETTSQVCRLDHVACWHSSCTVARRCGHR